MKRVLGAGYVGSIRTLFAIGYFKGDGIALFEFVEGNALQLLGVEEKILRLAFARDEPKSSIRLGFDCSCHVFVWVVRNRRGSCWYGHMLARKNNPVKMMLSRGYLLGFSGYFGYALSMEQDLVALATKHIKDILALSIEHKSPEKALVVYDMQNGLTNIITAAYRAALPEARFIDFDTQSKEEIIAACDAMQPNDLVVLIQSSNFLLDAFRIRIHLFQRKLKVIEHVHLYRNSEDVWDVYVNSLEYDSVWYRTVGPKLMAKLAPTKELRIRADGAELVVTGGLESPKPNIGDYTGMANIGGTFPIGEVFTEAKEFTKMNGSFMIYAFADTDFNINMHIPFRVDVKEGQVVGWAEDAPESFTNIVRMIKEVERPLIREVGFGLNRAITRERYLQDITAFERIYGMHLSLGEKHSVFKKTEMPTHRTKYHVDLFPMVDRVLADGEVIFEGGRYVV